MKPEHRIVLRAAAHTLSVDRWLKDGHELPPELEETYLALWRAVDDLLADVQPPKSR